MVLPIVEIENRKGIRKILVLSKVSKLVYTVSKATFRILAFFVR